MLRGKNEIVVKIQNKIGEGGQVGVGLGGGFRVDVNSKTSSPKGNDAHLRATIQSEKKWIDQFFRRLRAANSVVREFQTHSSSYVCHHYL